MGETTYLIYTYLITALKFISQTKIGISYLYINYRTFSAKVDESLFKNKLPHHFTPRYKHFTNISTIVVPYFTTMQPL